MKLITTSFGVLLIALLAALTACSLRSAPSAQASPTSSGTPLVNQPGVQVRLASLARRNITGTIDAYGAVVADANAQATLAFPADGQIANVYVTVGDRVREGQVLAELDERLAQRAVQQAQADLGAAQASYERARAGARPQELAQNAALAQAAQTKAETARAELSRKESLLAAGIASQRDVQQAHAAYAEALAEMRANQQQGSLLRAGPRLQDIDVARAQLAQAQSELAGAGTRASLNVIVAPFDGVVTARLKNAGEIVDRATPVLSLVNPNRTIVEVQLSEDQAALVHEGDRATITPSGTAQSIPGVVAVVTAAFVPDTRTLVARIRPMGRGLTPGSSARARIAVRSVDNGFVVPQSAIVKDPGTGQTEVFVAGAREGTYSPVQVRVILQSGQEASIAGTGLQPGGRVVTSGAYELLPRSGGSS